MKKKNNEIVATETSMEVEVIKTKEELRLEMQATLKQIEKKLGSMGATTTPIYKLTGNIFKICELDANGVNIHSTTDLSYLVKALSKMNRVQMDFLTTAENLQLPTTPTCMWLGRDISDWCSDLSTRIKQVAYSARINELNQAKIRLETFLSEEDRLSKTLIDVTLLLK